MPSEYLACRFPCCHNALMCGNIGERLVPRPYIRCNNKVVLCLDDIPYSRWFVRLKLPSRRDIKHRPKPPRMPYNSSNYTKVEDITTLISFTSASNLRFKFSFLLGHRVSTDFIWKRGYYTESKPSKRISVVIPNIANIAFYVSGSSLCRASNAMGKPKDPTTLVQYQAPGELARLSVKSSHSQRQTLQAGWELRLGYAQPFSGVEVKVSWVRRGQFPQLCWLWKSRYLHLEIGEVWSNLDHITSLHLYQFGRFRCRVGFLCRLQDKSTASLW